MSLVPVPSEGATCANCSSPIASNQRYCLACGQPASPVRLPFLDVLRAEQDLRAPTVLTVQSGSLPPLQSDHSGGWTQRYAGVFGLLSALLLAGLIGLLVGHWAAAKNQSPQVVKLDASGFGATASPATTSTQASTTVTQAVSSPAAHSSNSQEAAEAKEAKELEAKEAKAPPPKARKLDSNSLKKLGSSTGKQHTEEVNKLTNGIAPIETGG